MITFDVKGRFLMLEDFPNQQSQRAFRRLKFKAFVFEFFDSIEDLL